MLLPPELLVTIKNFCSPKSLRLFHSLNRHYSSIFPYIISSKLWNDSKTIEYIIFGSDGLLYDDGGYFIMLCFINFSDLIITSTQSYNSENEKSFWREIRTNKFLILAKIAFNINFNGKTLSSRLEDKTKSRRLGGEILSWNDETITNDYLSKKYIKDKIQEMVNKYDIFVEKFIIRDLLKYIHKPNTEHFYWLDTSERFIIKSYGIYSEFGLSEDVVYESDLVFHEHKDFIKN